MRRWLVASAAARHQQISAAAAFDLPSSKGCLKNLQISVRHVRHVRWTKATISINGKVEEGSHQVGAAPFGDVQEVPIGQVPRDDHRHGRRRSKRDDHAYLQGLRGFEEEADGEAQAERPKPTPTTTTPTTPTPTPTPTPSSVIQPGSYSGYDSIDAFYTLYVSPDGTQIQDVSVSSSYYNRLNCTPGTTLNDASFNIPDIAIASDGSFTGTTTQTSVKNGVVSTVHIHVQRPLHQPELIRSGAD